MHPALTKIKRYDNPPSLYQKKDWFRDSSLTLRTVDIIRDLRVFYNWMEDPGLQANWHPGENSQRLNRHYQLFLESENRQSFLIEKLKKPLFQFDIFEVYFHELYYRLPTTSGDCIMTYFIPNKENIPIDLKPAISLQLDYFFSFNGCRRLWLPIPEQQFILFDVFQEAGFKYKTAYVAKQQRYAVFFLKRANYLRLKAIELNNSDTE
jgi:hypothetical protein